MMRDNYMTTGEFAKIMGVTKHTLFHYDKIRLFCPEIVTEQDYRYYSMDQMEAFNTILLLKDLGMSLEEIKEFLVDRSTEKFLDVFAERENQIDAQIKKLQATKKWIAQRKKKLMLASQQDWNWVGIRTFPARYYLLRQMEDTSSKSFHKKIGSIIFFVGLPPRNVLICYATLDRMEKQCCSFITDGEELKNNLLFLRQAT